jgi:hypothetical protein
MKLGLLVSILIVALSLAGCSVGKGVGSAKGAIYALGCWETGNGDYSSDGITGTWQTPAPYDLQPAFFAGEPIDDLREYGSGTDIMSNRLIIHLQRSGQAIDRIDVLTFDVLSSYEVARCVRGRVDPSTGVGDWNATDCYRASDNSPGRFRLQWDSSIRAALTPNGTCPGPGPSSELRADLVADAISAPVPPSYVTATPPVVTDGSWSSWVEFQEFGGASQWNKAPADRDPIDGKFSVVFGDRLYASAFQLTLIDDGVVTAAETNQPLEDPSNPELDSRIGGAMSGYFDFDLARGQGAQAFP